MLSSDAHTFRRHAPAALIGAFSLAGLVVSSWYSYLLFHSLVELFSIVTAVVFVLAWHTRRLFHLINSCKPSFRLAAGKPE